MTVHVNDQDLIRRLIAVALAAHVYTDGSAGRWDDDRYEDLCSACERISDSDLVNIRAILAFSEQTP